MSAHSFDPGPDCTDDLFDWPLARVRVQGVALLPQSLAQALHALEADEAVCSALGAPLATEFIRLKRAEWLERTRHVSG